MSAAVAGSLEEASIECAKNVGGDPSDDIASQQAAENGRPKFLNSKNLNEWHHTASLCEGSCQLGVLDVYFVPI